MKKFTMVVGLLLIFALSFAGLQDRSSWIELRPNPENFIRMPELSSAPSTPDSGWGTVYVTGNDIYFKDDAGVATSLTGAASGGVSTLDEAYDGGGSGAGATINADSGPVLIAGSGADIGLQVTHSGAGNSIDIINSGTGKDIDGTSSTWSVTKAGAAVFASIGAFTQTGNLTLDDGVTASPSLIFTDATDETATFSKADAGVLSLTTDATDGLNVLVGNLWVGNGTPGTASMNGEDAYVEGQLEVDGTIQLDGALTAASTVAISGVITLANGLTIDNATNNALEWNENSEEIKWTFGSNSLDVVSTSGVVTLGLFDGSAATVNSTSDGAADDFTMSLTGATDSSLILSSTGTAADALQIRSSAGGIDILATGAATGEDIDITATGSSVNVTATEAVADAIVLSASTALGGIDITSNADIDISTTGAAGEDISLVNTGGSIVLSATEAAADAISLTSTAGGLDITTAATYDIDLMATGGTVKVIASETAADQFKVDAQGAVAGVAINLETTDGGILLNADGATGGDITLDAADDLTLTAAGAVVVTGVPTITLNGAVVLNTVATFTDSDATPDVTGKTYFNTNTTGVTITDFDGVGIVAGQLLVVTSKGAIVYDVTSSGIKGGTTDITTAAGDVTTFIYDGTDWLVVARMDMSDDLN